ncbi:MAG: hypothetical protein ABII88_09500 [Candidatus Omnitrophota bacterium]
MKLLKKIILIILVLSIPANLFAGPVSTDKLSPSINIEQVLLKKSFFNALDDLLPKYNSDSIPRPLVEEDFVIKIDKEFIFSDAVIEQKQFDFEKPGQAVIYPVLEVYLNGTKYKVGGEYYVVITLANNKKIYWGGQHNMSYSFFFEHYREKAQEIIDRGGVEWRHLDAHGDFGPHQNKPLHRKQNCDWQKEIEFGISKLSPADYLGYLVTTGMASHLVKINRLGPPDNAKTKHVNIPETILGLRELESSPVNGGVTDLDIDIIVGTAAEMDEYKAKDSFQQMAPPIISVCERSEVCFFINSSELSRHYLGVPLHINPHQAALFTGTLIENLASRASINIDNNMISKVTVKKAGDLSARRLADDLATALEDRNRSILNSALDVDANHVYIAEGKDDVKTILLGQDEGYPGVYDPEAYYLAVMHNDEVIGYGSVELGLISNEPKTAVLTFHVFKEYRHHGSRSKSAFRAFLEMVRTVLGAEKVRMSSWQIANPDGLSSKAILFYLSSGFKFIDEELQVRWDRYLRKIVLESGLVTEDMVQSSIVLDLVPFFGLQNEIMTGSSI